MPLSTTYSFNVNDTTSDPGEPLSIPADDFSSLSVTNNSGKTMSYSTDGGATWANLAAGSSLSYGYGLKSNYLFRKAEAGWATLGITVTYPGTEPANLRVVSGNVTGLVGPSVTVPLNGQTSNAITVLYDGDSITARATQAPLPADNSSTAYSGFGFNGYMTWERALLGCSYRAVNQAVSGETIEQITTRLLATDFTQYAAISMMCGTNNVETSTTADVTADIALIKLVCAKAATAGKPLRVLTIPPRDTGSWTAGEMAYVLAMNTAIRKLPMEYPNVFVGDAFYAIQDANTDPDSITGTLTDTRHPGKKGAYLIAKEVAPSMTAALTWAGYSRVLAAKRPFVDSAYTEKLTNTDFKTQTGGTNSLGAVLTVGTVPSGWRVQQSGSSTDVKSYFPFYIPDALRQRGMWASGMVFLVGDGVTNSGAAYICTTAHTDSGVFDATKFKRVWVTDYCWQLTVTGDAADDGISIQRSADIGGNHNDVVRGVCGIATEGEVAKVKSCYVNLEQWNALSFGTQRAHYNHSLYPANGVAEEAIGERMEGMFVTSAQAPFAAYTGTLGIDQFKLLFTLSAAGTASIIIYSPSMRKY